MKKEITIKVENNEERNKLGDKIHRQLIGNQDYIDNRIIVNVGLDKTVRYFVFDDSQTDPELKI